MYLSLAIELSERRNRRYDQHTITLYLPFTLIFSLTVPGSRYDPHHSDGMA